MEPILDINIAVFNQAGFLDQTLNSILGQKTRYPFRVLVGDDCSTDGSIEILKKFEMNYPQQITVIYQKKNLGLNSPERNGVILLKNSTAKYIALCDGDDYWNDDHKLEKQLSFLEAHPEFVGCFHNTEERYDDDDNLASFLYCDYPVARNVSFADLSYRNVIPTCSVIYRSRLFELPTWYHTLKMGDWPLHLLNAQNGDFWYIPKVMGVHRLHSKSSWMLQDATRNNKLVLDAYDGMIEGFANAASLKNQMVKAKKAFENHIAGASANPSFKERAKHLIKRAIEKL